MSPKFDLAKTQELADLFAVPRESRDSHWQGRFLAAVPEASLASRDPQGFQGPDRFPYFFLAMPQPLQNFTPFCITHILDHCLKTGLGVAVFSDPAKNPEWVFSYGDLSSYKLYGAFMGDPADEKPEAQVEFKETVQEARRVLTGAPAPGYFLQETRPILRQFLKAQGIKQPAVALLMDPSLKPSRNLVFNVFKDDFQSEDHYRNVLGGLAWFFPRGRGIVGLERSAVKDWKFDPL